MRFVFMSSAVDLNVFFHNSLSLNGSWSPKASPQVHIRGRCEHFCLIPQFVHWHSFHRFSLIRRRRHDRFVFISTKLTKLSIFWLFTSEKIFCVDREKSPKTTSEKNVEMTKGKVATFSTSLVGRKILWRHRLHQLFSKNETLQAMIDINLKSLMHR